MKLDLCYIINGFIHQNGENWQIKQFSPFLWHTKLPLLQVHGLALPFLETVSFLDEGTESSLISYPLTNFCPTQTCQVPLSQGATFFDILQRLCLHMLSPCKKLKRKKNSGIIQALKSFD